MTDDLSTDMYDLLGHLDPLREEQLARVLEIGRRRGGASRIAATRWPRARHPRRRTRALGIVALAAAACLALLLANTLPSSSPQDAYALSFSESDGYVIARIVNPYASVGELERELAANHLHVSLRLEPVSPGVVGKVISIGVDGSPSNGIQPLLHGRCVNGPCTVGVKVARGFSGSGSVYIGRAARRGEQYVSTPIGGDFAPGEPLHCSGLQGASVAKVTAVLRRKGLAVVAWRPAGSSSWTRGADAPAGAPVEEVMPVRPGAVELWLGTGSATSADAVLHAASMSGCGS